jgi:signal transduction histidine kinase
MRRVLVVNDEPHIRAVLRAHGGEVTASSPGPGRGATFVLTLPLRTTAPAANE